MLLKIIWKEYGIMQKKLKKLVFADLKEAFNQVKANHGRAGVDGVTIEMFEADLSKNLSILEDELKRQIYFPLPLLELLVDKGNGEARKLCIPVVRDRVVQTAVLQEIEPILDAEFEECSFAYRKGRSVRQAVYKIKDYYDQGYHWVVDADIDAFFDSVDHNILLEKINSYITNQNIVSLLEIWIKAEIWNGKSIKILEKGIAQGSPVSPILANLFLDEMDEELLKKGYKYVRYADDFIILCKSPVKAHQSIEFTNKILDTMLLKLDEADVVSFEQGFKYLGVIFLRSLIMTPFEKLKKGRKVLYMPPPLNINAYMLKKKKGW